VVHLKEPKSKLNFLGFTLRKVKLRRNPKRKFYLIAPSDKSLKRAKERIREHTSSENGYKAIPDIVKGLNRFLMGWGNYFAKGHPSEAFAEINEYVHNCMYEFLQRRSQRGYKKRDKSQTWYQFIKGLGIIQLTKQRFSG
jgi:RNA-directed DNA polymerase